MRGLNLKRALIGAALFMGLAFFAMPAPTYAVKCSVTDAEIVLGTCCSSLSCPSGQTCLKAKEALADATGSCSPDVFGINPVGNEVKGKLGNKDLRETAASLINVLLGLLGLIAVVIVLAGGFKWMTAGGNEEKVGEARKMIFSGIIGLAIILSAWAISLFVISQLTSATGSDVVINAG